MRLYEKEIVIPLIEGKKGLIKYFSKHVPNHLTPDEIPIRFVITKTDDKGYHCELGILSETESLHLPQIKSIFNFRKRPYENTKKFNVVLVIPTGIDAELGGHAGDAGALASLVAETCDTLITHPNVVNASDINPLPENAVYVEGSILSRLMMGTVGLQKVRSNCLEVIIDEHQDTYFTEAAINSVSAARASLGLSCHEVLRLKNKFKMKSKYAKSGRATGMVENLEGLYNELCSRRDNFDALALSSVIDVDRHICEEYYAGRVVNPWGGVEALLTHAISLLFNIPSAHSPMGYSQETESIDLGIVDPRMAAEAVSTTYLHCVLKGLHRSPKIITDLDIINQSGIISAADVSCLIIPDKCVGLPTLAALEQGIPVIAVKENKNLMENNLNDLPWNQGQLIITENYLEAVGDIHTLKSGVSPDSVRRPLEFTKVSD